MKPTIEINVIKNQTEGDILVSNIYELELIPDNPSGVIFKDGTYLQCGFAGHTRAFAVGAFLILAHTIDNDEWNDVYADVKAVTVDGILDVQKLNGAISLYGMTEYASGNIKHDNPELYEKVGGATFIGSDYNKLQASEVVKELAEKWIMTHGKYIWAMRCCLYILQDEDFFEENSKPEWSEMLWDNAGIELPSTSDIPYFNPYRMAPLDERYNIANVIQSWSDEYDFIELQERYGKMLELAGREGFHGSLWHENFTTIENDDLITAYEKSVEGSSLLSW